MLIISGNSSRLLSRIHLPSRVSRASSGSSRPFASRSSVMVRNLYMLNIFSSFPGRFCVKITGFPARMRTASARIPYSQQSSTSAHIEHRISSIRFMYFSYKVCFRSFVFIFFSFHPFLLFSLHTVCRMHSRRSGRNRRYIRRSRSPLCEPCESARTRTIQRSKQAI